VLWICMILLQSRSVLVANGALSNPAAYRAALLLFFEKAPNCSQAGPSLTPVLTKVIEAFAASP
jgi:hypothetical protein